MFNVDEVFELNAVHVIGSFHNSLALGLYCDDQQSHAPASYCS